MLSSADSFLARSFEALGLLLLTTPFGYGPLRVAVALLRVALAAVVYHDLRQARGDLADEELAAVFA